MEGGAIFGVDEPLITGHTYYLVETGAPVGYIKSDEWIKIIVDATGVYADAGTADDDVTVLRGVGSVLKSMVQFAEDDRVDATLHDIQAVLQTGTEDSDSISWNTVTDSWDTALHLNYSSNHAVLELSLIHICVRLGEGR